MKDRRRKRVSWLFVSGLLLGCAGGGATGSGSGELGEGEGDEGTGGEAGTGDVPEVPGEFGPEEAYELRLNEETPAPLVLEMNRDEVAELFGDAAKDIKLLELDSAALLTNTLEEIKNACGTSWAIDDENPNHDCSLTELGQSFEGPDGTWQTSAEYAMVRILTMTPANVDVEGTSSEDLRGLADALNIGGGYSQILSDALGIPRTTPVVSTQSLVRAFKEDFVASHPNMDADGNLVFYLEDALNDLSTMTERYGPAGDHPGVVDPSFPVYGEVFGPDFQMRAVADSNLRLVDGIDGDAGKGFMSVVADVTGPSFDDELEFDFTNSDRFEVTGIVEDLVVDLRFKVLEDDNFIWSCLGGPTCHANLPGSPVDASSVWASKPWLLEHAVAKGAYYEYENRVFNGSYFLGLARVQLGQDGDPAGWVHYSVPLNLGNPPEDQYVWETILEVAQVALHDTQYNTFAEGDADLAFTLYDVPVGITGSQAAEAVRPFLQEQSSLLSDFILGDFKKNNDRVDFYFRRASNGEPYLFFVAPEDLQEGELYGYERPGFYESSSLSPESKVSEQRMDGVGDEVHEKLALEVGETSAYYEDDDGQVWRIRVERRAQDDDTVQIFVAPRLD